MIVWIFTLSLTFSSLMNAIVINNTGEISLFSITAKSGSPADIQAAINAIVSVGGGTVYVPAGTYTFNPTAMGTVNITFTNVPINIIGAGIGVTFLQETINPGGSSMFKRVWGGQNYNGSAVRISGISFVGFVVNETATSNNAIVISCTQDFRIDHCSFQDFAGCAISTNDNTGGTYKLVDRGVIDHCSFDNPYKAVLQPHNTSGAWYSVWGYGIILVGDYYHWAPNMSSLLGQYYPTISVDGSLLPQPIYIENCNFSRCRHAISSNGAAYYVSRYNYFEKASPYGQNDVHGYVSGSIPWGGRGMESYSNIFNLSDDSYSTGQSEAIEPRGGGGVCWNNTVILNPGTLTIGWGNDGEVAPYDVQQFYIWNNTAMRPNETLVDFNSQFGTAPGSTSNYIINVNYFLRAPNQTLDGFTYAPYTYPHPLTLTGTT